MRYFKPILLCRILGAILFLISLCGINESKAQQPWSYEDEFKTLDNWMVVTGAHKSIAQIEMESNVPEGHGPEVLCLNGRFGLVAYLGIELRDGVLEVLWKDVDAAGQDADGVLMARVQTPQQMLRGDPISPAQGGYWLEHDSDLGFHLNMSLPPSRENPQGKEASFRKPGQVLKGDEYKTTAAWNKTGWIWHKWELKGPTLKAKYWSSADPEPKDWMITVVDSTYSKGVVGLNVWSGHAHVAYLKVTPYDKQGQPSVYLHSRQEVFDSNESVPVSLFVSSPKEMPVTAKFTVFDSLRKITESSQKITVKKGIDVFKYQWNTGAYPDGIYRLHAQLFSGAKNIGEDEFIFRIISSEGVRHILGEVEAKLKAFTGQIEKAKAQGVPVDYATVTKRVAEDFLLYVQDDLNKRKLERSRRIVDHLASSIEKAQSELQEMMSDPAKQLQIHRPVPFNLKIRDGAYYRVEQSPEVSGQSGDGKPVFLSGVDGYDYPVADIPKMREYGFNTIAIEIGPSSTVTGPGEKDVTDERINSFVLKALRSANAAGVSVMLLVSPHYFPQWAYQMYPEVKSCGSGFLKYCIEHPQARKVVERHLRYLVSKIKNEPSLESYCLANEPRFVERCEFTLKKFQTYLKNEFGEITKLNRIWKTSYGNFEDIPLPPEDVGDIPVKYHWHTFRGLQIRDFFAWMKNIIREEDPVRPVHIKFMMDEFNPDEGRFGIDREALGEITDVTGCDGGTSFPARAGEYAGDFLTQSMFYDLLKSFQPEKPIYNSEYHIIKDNDPIHYPGNYIRTAIWEGALHGQSAFAIWVWDRSETDPEWGDNILTRSEATESAGRTSLDLQRLAKYLVRFPQASTPIALFYSRTSKLLSQTYLQELKKAYEGLNFLGIPVKFISERQTLSGKLQDCHLLIVPGADYVREDAFQAVVKYARSGGKVFATGEAFRFDQHGRERELSSEFPELKMATKAPLKLVRDTPRLWTANINPEVLQGKENLLLFDARQYNTMFDRLLDEAGIARAFRLYDARGGLAWGVECKSVEFEGKKILSLVNWLKEPMAVRIISQIKMHKVKNLIDNSELAFEDGLIELKPMAPVLLSVE